MIVVASVPSGHVYVRHLSAPDGGDGITRLPDPPSRGAGDAATWWPPSMLDPVWIRENAHAFDVMHVHFGFDHLSPESLQDVVRALRDTGKPLVLTVHDLRNPHHLEADLHDAQLGVLVPAADAVVTLTHGAAGEVKDRWARDATVLPHPHVVDEPQLSAPRRRHEDYVVGVHVKSLRAGMDPLPVVEELVTTLPRLSSASLRVDAHTDVMVPGYDRHDSALASRLESLAEAGSIDLVVHDYFTDDELWRYLGGLDVSVLPYRFGTHSGWLEACHDLGTVVLAPDCGYYAEQRPCVTYRRPGEPPRDGVRSLSDAVTWAHRERPAWRADARERFAERRYLAAAHEDVYRAALTRGVTCTS